MSQDRRAERSDRHELALSGLEERSVVSTLARAILRPFDRVFNRIFDSRYNWLYRSGTLSVGFLIVALVTGLYLLLFYKISGPFESVTRINEQVYAGRWIRSLHRYASDAAVLTTAIHLLRVIAQQKTWGPWLLSWISGIVLLGFLFISGWTGFIMVWDEQAQAMATWGSQILDQLPIFPEPISHAFSGAAAVSPSFFFMNLFLHVAVPLGMVFTVWIHTAKIKNATLLPERKFYFYSILALLALSLVWPASLGHKAHLLSVPSKFYLDGFYNFWLGAAKSYPGMTLLAWGITLFVLLSVPLWVRPFKNSRAKAAFNDPKVCQGCRQCYEDCPYEAVQMIAREGEAKGSKEFAQVLPDRCVSCGICSASCSVFTMGPEDRKAGEQLFFAQKFMREYPDRSSMTAVVLCQRSELSPREKSELLSRYAPAAEHFMECGGSLHASVIHRIASEFKKTVLVCCPPQNCVVRGGTALLKQRIEGVRSPSLPTDLTRERIEILTPASGERLLKPDVSFIGQWSKVLLRMAGALGLLLLLGMVSQINFGAKSDNGVLRLSWRVAEPYTETCTDAVPGDSRLLHMRQGRVCQRRPVSYRLYVEVKGVVVHEESLSPGGVRSDRPLYVEKEFAIGPGQHELVVLLEPDLNQHSEGDTTAASGLTEGASGPGAGVGDGVDVGVGNKTSQLTPRSFRWNGPVEVQENKITLVTLDVGSGELMVKQ